MKIRRKINNIIEKYGYKLVKVTDSIESRHEALSKKLNKILNGTIKYGPFKGLKFSEDSWWGYSDRASMLLGLYEQEVLASLKDLPNKYRYFIDVGAADGYYGIGVIIGGLFEKSWCYEISERGREAIQLNAKLNNISDRVLIRGKADHEFKNEFSEDEAAQSVLFVDIEGDEFKIFDEDLFKKFRNSIIFIELHDWFFLNSKELLDNLKNNAEKFFKITSLTTTHRDLSVFEELWEFNDTDRWLICSERRDRLMTWWRLDPL